MIIQGQITAKELKVTKANVQYACFSIGTKKFNSFDAVTITDFNIGDYVEIETEKKGLYENLKTMKKIVVDVPKPQNSTTPVASLLTQEKPIVKQEFHQSIEACRYEAMDLAIKFKPTLNLDEAFLIGQRFLNWIMEGK